MKVILKKREREREREPVTIKAGHSGGDHHDDKSNENKATKVNYTHSTTH